MFNNLINLVMDVFDKPNSDLRNFTLSNLSNGHKTLQVFMYENDGYFRSYTVSNSYGDKESVNVLYNKVSKLI